MGMLWGRLLRGPHCCIDHHAFTHLMASHCAVTSKSSSSSSSKKHHTHDASKTQCHQSSRCCLFAGYCDMSSHSVRGQRAQRGGPQCGYGVPRLLIKCRQGLGHLQPSCVAEKGAEDGHGAAGWRAALDDAKSVGGVERLCSTVCACHLPVLSRSLCCK